MITAAEKKITQKLPVERKVNLLEGNWRATIIWYIHEKYNRFSTIKRCIPSATDRILRQQIRGLQSDGLIKCRYFDGLPPYVAYFLTARAKSFLPAIKK